MSAHIDMPADIALSLLIRYMWRKYDNLKWEALAKDIRANGHENAFLLDNKKLRFWKTRGSVPYEKPFLAIVDFIQSEKFIAIVPEAKKYLPEREFALKTGKTLKDFFSYGFNVSESEFSFKWLGGMWEPAVHSLGTPVLPKDSMFKCVLFVMPTEDPNFALVHFYQFHWMYGLSKIVDFSNIYSGYLFLKEGANNKEVEFQVWNRFSRKNFIKAFDFEILQASRRGWVLNETSDLSNQSSVSMAYARSEKEKFFNQIKFTNDDLELRFRPSDIFESVDINNKSTYGLRYKQEYEDVLGSSNLEVSDDARGMESRTLSSNLMYAFDKLFLNVVPENE
ncbi:hypothetical protein NBRC116494_06760 [Aurantivibrio plasticivorans]